MNTTETNKKLAEFLGWVQFGNVELYATTFHNDKGSLKWLTKDMKFHNDWNWIMMVIIKAKEGEAELNKEGDKLLYNIYEALTDVNINTTYNACSMFVDWYNKQKP